MTGSHIRKFIIAILKKEECMITFFMLYELGNALNFSAMVI